MPVEKIELIQIVDESVTYQSIWAIIGLSLDIYLLYKVSINAIGEGHG